jgi:2-polyprenyl-6-methoxyphenol hydroxylase-like FAD-dependent oxidoreductase
MQNPSWSAGLGTNMHIIERRDLQRILLERVRELGEEVTWERKLENMDHVGKDGKGVCVSFRDGKSEVFSILIGADGAWSEVRREMEKRSALTAKDRWVPGLMGATGIYGISSPELLPLEVEGVDKETIADTHGIWLDQGSLSTSPLPDGKIRWDLIIPEERNDSTSKLAK